MTVLESRPGSWRLVEIVSVAVIAVVFGAIFQLWNVVWEASSWAFPPARGAIAGVWMLPAVVAPLVVRRPGAAIFAETLAAIVEMAVGSPWGLGTVVYGLVQGAGAELIFAFFFFRAWGLPVAIVAGGAAGLGGALLDLVLYYPTWATDWQVAYIVIVVISAALIAGLGGWLLVRALAQTGVLSPFPAGRSQRPV
ncbi:MAG: ECF transporter S component [Chloroflexota bacterium]|nr:ECF transporter S component [Chloroflexota bacterium]